MKLPVLRLQVSEFCDPGTYLQHCKEARTEPSEKGWEAFAREYFLEGLSEASGRPAAWNLTIESVPD
jgi:hypothetical protein